VTGVVTMLTTAIVIVIGILLVAAAVWAVRSPHDDAARLRARSDAQNRIDRNR
jgi:hypothetical protein